MADFWKDYLKPSLGIFGIVFVLDYFLDDMLIRELASVSFLSGVGAQILDALLAASYASVAVILAKYWQPIEQ